MSSSFSEAARSILPRNYSQIRPHHAVVLYAAVRYLTSSSIYRKLADKILSLMSRTTERLIPLLYAGFVPDFLIRFGIRIQLYDHLAILRTTDCELDLARKMEIVEQLTNMPIAIQTQLANAQHYEVPAAFYDLCLGPRKKYSSGLWPTHLTTFEESELLILDLYCERAQLQDGMSIVDLGCGWGSLTLHLAEKYPNAKITSISNSHSQREYILETAKARGYNVDNINVITVSTIVP
jgi:cyclopropane-fatty-acyl-phospholipid synthase